MALKPFIANKGLILDAGANNGKSAVKIAAGFPNHVVLAIEPIASNVKEIKKISRGVENIKILHASLGNRSGAGSYGASLDRSFAGGKTGPQIGLLKYYRRERGERNRSAFNVTTLDEVTRDEHVAFAHLDLEGGELAALTAGRRTIANSRPVMSVESFPFSRKREHAELIALLRNFDYEVYSVPESCGADDCRNSICLPRELKVNVPRECVCESCNMTTTSRG